MIRQLSAAVIASFRDSAPAQHRRLLSCFSARQWQENFSWLDASGLALYFLDQLRTANTEGDIPASILAQLEQRHADNQQRTRALFEEFVRINTAFGAAGLEYVNLKGFTLVPDYCRDLSLRCQMDFDFLLRGHQAQSCREVLHGLGYSLMASNAHVMEFKSNAGSVPHVRDLYKARPQHSVEVHLCDVPGAEFQPRLLRRSRVLSIHGVDVPALAAIDMFLGQASHLFRHIRSEWTRISWLHELKHATAARREDPVFWNTVRTGAGLSDSSLAVAASLRLAEKAFGQFAPAELRDWATERLPASVALWIDRYGDDVLLADFPGSKLYLILDHELDGSRGMSATIRRRLLPMHGPARVTAAPSGNVGERFRAFKSQLRYLLFRLRFHLAQTPRYLWEAWRWNRLCADSKERRAGTVQVTASELAEECQAGHGLQSSYRSLTVKQ